MSIDRASAEPIPGWQVGVVLVGFPLGYVLNSFAPWSIGLFGAGDRAFYPPFFISILALHWISALVVTLFVRRAGLTFADLGLSISPRSAARLVGTLLVLGAGFVLFRYLVPYAASRPRWLVFLPVDASEQLLFVFVALSAGFCDELVYRGFGITALQSRGFSVRHAVVLSTVSFVFIHGMGGLVAFPLFFLAGLLFAGIYLGRVSGVGPGGLAVPDGQRNLLRPMVVHAIGDLTAILAP